MTWTFCNETEERKEEVPRSFFFLRISKMKETTEIVMMSQHRSVEPQFCFVSYISLSFLFRLNFKVASIPVYMKSKHYRWNWILLDFTFAVLISCIPEGGEGIDLDPYDESSNKAKTLGSHPGAKPGLGVFLRAP